MPGNARRRPPRPAHRPPDVGVARDETMRFRVTPAERDELITAADNDAWSDWARVTLLAAARIGPCPAELREGIPCRLPRDHAGLHEAAVDRCRGLVDDPASPVTRCVLEAGHRGPCQRPQIEWGR